MFYAWQELKKLKEANEIIKGEVVQVVRGGLLVDIIGVRGFVPSSQIQNRTIEYKVGDKIEVKIISLDEEHNNFVLSNKKIYSDSIENAKEEIFSQIEVGQVIKGRVVRVTDFGAFIDLGGADGLLHISEMSWGRVNDPSSVVKVGDVVKILSGPFSGMEGTVESMNDQTQVATVLIILFGRETPTDLNYVDIEPAL